MTVTANDVTEDNATSTDDNSPHLPSSNFQILPSTHDDYVHDISFDHYGRRVATCSGDRTVCIWDLDDNGDFALSNSTSHPHSTNPNDGSKWKAHSGSVNGLSWAHPEYGQLLATCGSDGLAIVWEERAEGAGFGGNTNKRWVDRARLVDARRSLSTVKFAPRHFRLQLATGSADGTVRIYEAVDVSNLTQWMLMHTIKAEEEDQHSQGGDFLGVSCLDWSGGRFEAPALVVGGCSGNVTIYRYSDASQCWGAYVKLEGHVNPRRGVLDVAWCPNVGRSYHLISSCGRDRVLRVHRLKRIRGGSSNMASVAGATSGTQSTTTTVTATGATPITANTTTTNKDTTMPKIVGRGENSGIPGENEMLIARGMAGLEIASTQVLDTDGREVWRCAWNVTGTVLASSGDAGLVQLWKSDFHAMWKCVSEIHGSVAEQEANHSM